MEHIDAETNLQTLIALCNELIASQKRADPLPWISRAIIRIQKFIQIIEKEAGA